MNKTLIVALIAAAVGLGAGWTANGWRLNTKISTLKKDHAEADSKAARENVSLLEKGFLRGDRLSLELAEKTNHLTTLEQEKNREIARLTTGRRCLDRAVVGVLNRDSAAAGGGPVSKASGGTLRANGSAAADSHDGQNEDGADDGRFATDTDVAGWANLCRTRYDTCRGHLDAIREFYADKPGAGGAVGE